MRENIPFHDPNEWELEESLGEGKLSVGVFKAKKINGKINNFDLPNKGKCVIKIIKVENETKLYIKECSIVDKLIDISDGLKGVIKYYGYSQYKDGDKEYVYIYMEYLKNYQSIGKLLKEKDSKFSEDQVYYIGLQLLKCIKILHDNNIVHRDIKCSNVLLNLSNGKIKFIDFGISKYCESISKTGCHTFAGTPTHMAPEVKPYNNIIINKSDIWSIGCTLLEILGADLSISADIIINNLEIKKKSLKLLIQHCLVIEPTSRDYFFPPLNERYFKWPKSEIKKMVGFFPSVESCNQTIINNSIPSVYEHYIPSFNQPITPNSIPSSVAELNLPSFNQPITPNSIPTSVTELYLESFNQPITPNSIPPSVTELYLSSFNQPISPNSIPSSVNKLDLPSFNEPITPNSIPSSVTVLNLFSFNQPITPNSIPESVTSLFLSSFNQHIKPNSIPSSVRYLDLPSFDQPITPNLIPSSVTDLELSSYNQLIIPHTIPSSIKKLVLRSFNQPITPNSIPSSINKLNLQSFNQPITPFSIPSSVTELNLPSFNQPIVPNSIPSSITKLDLPSFNQTITPNLIPSSVNELSLLSFNQPITPNSIPSSVTKLYLPSYNQPITLNSIPKSVTKLDLSSFNQVLYDTSIPPLVKTLKLNQFNLNKNCDDSLPDSILKFECNYNFKSPFKRVNFIPRNTSTLILGNYNHRITKESIPKSVISLKLGSDFKDFESFKNLPPSIIILKFGVVNCVDDNESIKLLIPKNITDIQIKRDEKDEFEN